MNNTVTIPMKLQGEYRYRLIGPDNKVKQSCDWKPNLLLDRGLDLIRTFGIGNRMALGNSDIAADVSQVGLQGTLLGIDISMGSPTSRNQLPVAPNWEHWQIKEALFPTGIGNGTIKEFVIGDQDLDTTEATIRVVLDTPIVKGALDELVIEHRFTFWPFLGDVVDVINISGVPYNVTMRHFNGDNNQNPNNVISFGVGIGYGYGCFEGATLPADMDVASISGTGKGGPSGNVITFGGTSPNFWVNTKQTYGVDTGNGLLNMFAIQLYNDMAHIACMVGKVSDGSPIDKQNIHELKLNWRLYPVRYTP